MRTQNWEAHLPNSLRGCTAPQHPTSCLFHFISLTYWACYLHVFPFSQLLSTTKTNKRLWGKLQHDLGFQYGDFVPDTAFPDMESGWKVCDCLPALRGVVTHLLLSLFLCQSTSLYTKIALIPYSPVSCNSSRSANGRGDRVCVQRKCFVMSKQANKTDPAEWLYFLWQYGCVCKISLSSYPASVAFCITLQLKIVFLTCRWWREDKLA